MDNKQTNGKVIETDFYIAHDTEGKLHWYNADPLTSPDRSKVEVDINDFLDDYTGGPTIENPARVRFFVALMDRAIPFAISQPNDIRTGKLRRHFEDRAGHIVEILQHPSNEPAYPLMGILFDHEGNMHGNALYGPTGNCKDGVADHDLICVAGDATPKKKEEEL